MTAADDFTNTAVPVERRVRGINILLTWLGFILVVASMSFGGGLAAQLSLRDLVTSILIGNLFLAACGLVAGFVGSQSGLSFGSLAARVFSRGTWRLAILYIPLVLIGWYAIESSIFGNFIADTFHLTDIARRAVMAAAAIFFSISAYIGVRFIGRVSYILIPAVLFISAFALLSVPAGRLQFGFGPSVTNVSVGIGIVMSTWIFSALLVVPDLTRFVRRPAIGALIGATGVMVGNTLALSIGAFAAAYTKQSDPSLILVGLGFTPLALILTFASVWSTNDNNMYSSSLSVAKVLGVSRRAVVLGLAAVGAAIALFNPATIQTMFAFLGFMGASASPLGGIVLGAYLFQRGAAEPRNSAVAAWLAWGIATFITLQMKGAYVVPVGVALGCCLWWVINSLIGAFAGASSKSRDRS